MTLQNVGRYNRYASFLFLYRLPWIDLVPSANEWGRKRVDFYVDATSRVREDGFLNDEEHELLELEEEDAVERQHKMDSINSVMDPTKLASFIDVSDDESSENDGKSQPHYSIVF